MSARALVWRGLDAWRAEYAGQIKVTVIRESRAVDFAK